MTATLSAKYPFVIHVYAMIYLQWQQRHEIVFEEIFKKHYFFVIHWKTMLSNTLTDI